jgi:hypothetical protein
MQLPTASTSVTHNNPSPSRHPHVKSSSQESGGSFEFVELQQQIIQFYFQSFFWHQGWLKASALFKLFWPPFTVTEETNLLVSRPWVWQKNLSSFHCPFTGIPALAVACQQILGSGKLICRCSTVRPPAFNFLQFGRFLCLLFIMANGLSSLVQTPTLVGAKPLVTSPSSTGAKPLDTAPALMIENPLPSHSKLACFELQLGSKTIPGLKFCPGRLKHVESIDVIFADNDQANVSMVFTAIFLPLNHLPCHAPCR